MSSSSADNNKKNLVSNLLEVPVAYPLLKDNGPRTYVVNDQNGTIRLFDDHPSSLNDDSTSNYNSTDANPATTIAQLDYDSTTTASYDIGMTSVSEIIVGGGGGKNQTTTTRNSINNNHSWIVTTSPVSHRVVAVTVLSSSSPSPSNDDDPRIIYIDMNLECTMSTEPIVAIQAFNCGSTTTANSAAAGCFFQLVIVDAAAVILTLRFTLESLTPIAVPSSTSGLVDVRCFVAGSTTILSSSSSTPTLTSSSVAFVSSDIVLISMSPQFVAVDLYNESMYSWSKSVCLEEMRSRAASWNTILSKSAEMLLGKWEPIIIDMDPVAAVCTVPNDPQQTVFTLHTDGMLRHWTMPPLNSSSTSSRTGSTGSRSRRLMPHTVRDIPIAKRYIPHPDKWESSNATNTTYLAATRLVDANVYVVCVYVLTTTANDEATTPHSMIVVDVPVEFIDEVTYVEASHAIPLTVPVGDDNNDDAGTASSSYCLVDMQFDPQSDQCQLRALFRTTTTDRHRYHHHDLRGGGGASMPTPPASVLCTYTPSTLSVLSHTPIVTNPSMTLDGVAEQEWERIAALSFSSLFFKLKDHPTDDGDDDRAALEEALYFIDQRFLRYVFRPTEPRGNGTVMSPKEEHIYGAMQLLAPSLMEPTGDVEVDVVLFLKAWRKQERNYIVSMTPVKLNQRHAATMGTTPGTAMAQYTGASAYKTFLNREYGDDDDGGLEMDIDDDPMGTLEEEESTPMQLEEELMDHENHWRHLLWAIAEQEQREQLPVGMYIPSASLDSAVVVVRPCCISSMMGCIPAANADNHGNSKQHRLDNLSLQILDTYLRNSEQALHLQRIEQLILESILEYDLAVQRNTVVHFKAMLKGILREDENCRKLLRELSKIPEKDWTTLLKGAPQQSCMPGLSMLFGQSEHSDTVLNDMVRQLPVMGNQGRLASGSLVIRTLHSMRRVFLARCLVILDMDVGDDVINMALSSYLLTVAIINVSVETVPLPPLVSSLNRPSQKQPPVDVGATTSTSPANWSRPPPMKRTRVSSFFELYNKTDECMVLDTLLIHLSQRLTRVPEGNAPICAMPVQLGQDAIANCFQFESLSSSDSPSPFLSELGLLTSMATNEICHPSLELRLMSVSLALGRRGESQETVKRREERVAQCLVLLSRTMPHAEAESIVMRAFQLLPFDEKSPEASKQHLTTLTRRMGGNEVGGKLLLTYIAKAIEKCGTVGFQDSHPINEMLWSALFSAAVSIQDWSQAYDAALKYPVASQRLEKFNRLVRAMVDGGALQKLLDMCLELEAKQEVVQSAYYFPDIVADALASMELRNLYTSMVTDPEPPSDYQGALYCLYVARAQWRKAAHVMDMRYVTAREALAMQISELSLDQHEQRQSLIVQEMLVASTSCSCALKLHPQENERYLVSGARESDPLIPFHLRGKSSHSKLFPQSRNNAGAQGIYMSLVDLEARAVRVKVLKTLFDDSAGDSFFALNALVNEGGPNAKLDSEIRNQLFESGFYVDGLLLSKSMDKSRGCMPRGRGLFFDSVFHLIATYLLPLALDADCTPPRPSILQLQAGIDSLTLDQEPEHLPTLISGSRSKKLVDLERAEIRIGAMMFIRALTIKFSSSMEPLAVEVAKMMLHPNRAATALPAWLEHLLMFGTIEADLPGLFARRRLPDTDSLAYLGNPVALLDLYTRTGLLSDACRIVSTVVSHNGYREHIVPSRLPENGDMDDLPMEKIDLLWNLVENRLKKQGQVGSSSTSALPTEIDQLRQAQSDMEAALKKYFELLEISAMGVSSARALA